MNRRDFLGKTGCGFAGLVATPMLFSMGNAGGQEKRKRSGPRSTVKKTQETKTQILGEL